MSELVCLTLNVSHLISFSQQPFEVNSYITFIFHLR